ncbi:MAG TPA: LPS-assembly protein LptD [Methylomirabilota bacterium]|nr:LPS-assembly protein LptD [Methylomirabilota bacterium]
MRNSVVPQRRTTRRGRALASVAVLAILAGAGVDSFAQVAEPATPSLANLATSAKAPEGRMLVEADSLVYDIDADSISAVGGVVIYYGAYTLVAERVEVNRSTQRVTASGSVEITDPAGNIVRGDTIDLSDDLRDGVIQALELVTEQRTAFTATSARRTDGDVTTFENGVYLPCVDCDGVKGRKPVWQIRANRIVHRQGERTVTFEKARFEFLGVPIAYVPVLTQPDPTARRKSGFLFPSPTYSSERGVGLQVPYFHVLAPNMDVTLSPAVYTRQGLLGDIEFRHRLMSGAYSIQVAGLHQADPNEFAGTSGDRDFRGSVSTEGRFTINERWDWGWDLAVATDRSFFDDYDRDEGGGDDDDIVNDIHLTGVDARNRFEGHVYGFFVTQEDSTLPDAPEQDLNLQEKQPFAHPVIDHQVYADEPVAGGELSITSNFTSLSRTNRDIYEFETSDRTRLRGAAGTFSRASVDALWRRRIVDSLGQVFTPFVSLRGDVMFSSPDAADRVGLEDNEIGVRAMPTAGLEYSYPVLVESSIGSSVIEPIAQLIVRPDETETGDFSNEDAQSLVFDTTTLFDYDKFSGYDRIEGGGRLNLGLRYTGRFVNGMSVTGVVGQSIHLFGENSFSTDTPYQTGEESGLDHDASDYVASLSLDTARGFLIGGSARFDQENGEPNRVDGQLIGYAGRFTGMLTYAFIRSQPDIGIDDDRSEVQAAANLHLAEHWRLFGATRFDLENETFVRNAVGLAYDDEAFSASISYSEDKTRATGEPTDRTVYFRLGLRTLGDASGSADALN